MNTCAVVFPIYKLPTPIDFAFLENGINLTKNHKQFIVAPESLQIDNSFGELASLEIKYFPKYFFEGIAGYNKLMLSKDFYSTFNSFDYILIHQADVYLFKNELDLWCAKGYDYIGAPWFRPDKLNKGFLFNLLQKLKIAFKTNKTYAQRHNKVGNGGLSLRKINKALEVLNDIDENILNQYTQTPGEAFNEDIFWSLKVPELYDFKIPEWQEAMAFAFEFYPETAYQYLGQQLPFGCHAPLKHNIEFWKKFIPHLQNVD